MKKLTLITTLFAILISTQNAFANGRIGECSYGIDSSDRLFLSNGIHLKSKSFALGSGDMYKCSENDILGLLKLTIPFVGEVAGFVHLDRSTKSCIIREAYGYDNGRWEYDPGLKMAFNLSIGSQCN